MHAFIVVCQNDTIGREAINEFLLKRGIPEFDRVYAEPQSKSSIGISDIRIFIKSLSLSSSGGKGVAGVIYDASLLTPESYQALLKTLEEPPPGVVLYIGTHNAAILPQTILSRCECLYVPSDVSAIESDVETHSQIETLLSTTPGQMIALLSTIGKTKEDLLRWTDRAVRILRSEVLEGAKDQHGGGPLFGRKKAILKSLLRISQYQKNNVSPQLLVEHAFLMPEENY